MREFEFKLEIGMKSGALRRRIHLLSADNTPPHTVPTSKPRVSWIIDPDVLKLLKDCADKNRRPVSWEAEVAIEFYVKHQQRLDDQ